MKMQHLVVQPVPEARRLSAQEGERPGKAKIIAPRRESELAFAGWAARATHLRHLAQEKKFPIHLTDKQGRLIGTLIDIGPDGRPVYLAPTSK